MGASSFRSFENEHSSLQLLLADRFIFPLPQVSLRDQLLELGMLRDQFRHVLLEIAVPADDGRVRGGDRVIDFSESRAGGRCKVTLAFALDRLLYIHGAADTGLPVRVDRGLL